MSDSKNALTDFDLSLALAQKAINTQMTYAWDTWKATQGFTNQIEVFPLTTKGKPSPYGLSATIEPLEISLNVPNGKLGQVQVRLTLSSGEVSYFDADEGAAGTCKIETPWVFTFLTDLQKEPISIDTLEQVDPKAYKTARDVIQQKGYYEFNDSVFSIEYLFLKLTNVDLVLTDDRNFQLPPNLPAAAVTRAKECLNLLLNKKLGKFSLGTVVRRKPTSSTPTFALTDFVFNVQAHPSAPMASTLAYLGMLAGRPLPGNLSVARTKLENEWMRPEQITAEKDLISGILAIRRDLFLDQYLMPKFVAALKAKELGSEATRADEVTRTFTHQGARKSTRTMEAIVHDFLAFGESGYELKIRADKGSNRLSLSGRVHGRIDIPLDFIGEIGRFWVEGERKLTGTVKLTGSGTAANFAVKPVLAYKFADFQKTREGTEGLAILEQGVSWVLKKMGIAENDILGVLQSYLNADVDKLEKVLNEVLNNIQVDLSNQMFIPPGGGVFTYQNLHFSDETGDLLLDVIYQAPK